MEKTFRIVGILEGLSFLLLLFVAMPMKYMFDQPIAVTYMGRGHGFLFLAYVAIALNLTVGGAWPAKRLLGAIIAAVLPFGPFVFEKKFLPAQK